MGIDKEKRLLTAADELRHQAEERLRLKTAELHSPWSEEGPPRLIHELEVQRTELEIQNAELRQARDGLETALERAEDAFAEKRRELEELNISLEARIARAVDELRQKDQMLVLQDRLAVMGEMINNIAHQWRQPLNTLGLLIQQLPLFYGSPEFSREFLEKNTTQVMQLVQQMSRTIDSFRNFFRSDKQEATFDVNRVIAQTVLLIEKSFADQQIGIVLQAEGDPMVSGYPNEYAQVLLNILMNARDALVAHKVADARIIVHSFSEGDTAIVTITDNAGGVVEEIKDRLFEPYFTTKGPDKGTGIGLFMSKTIIEKNMSGRLTMRNTGSGAEFRIEV